MPGRFGVHTAAIDVYALRSRNTVLPDLDGQVGVAVKGSVFHKNTISGIIIFQGCFSCDVQIYAFRVYQSPIIARADRHPIERQGVGIGIEAGLAVPQDIVLVGVGDLGLAHPHRVGGDGCAVPGHGKHHSNGVFACKGRRRRADKVRRISGNSCAAVFRSKARIVDAVILGVLVVDDQAQIIGSRVLHIPCQDRRAGRICVKKIKVGFNKSGILDSRIRAGIDGNENLCPVDRGSRHPLPGVAAGGQLVQPGQFEGHSFKYVAGRSGDRVVFRDDIQPSHSVGLVVNDRFALHAQGVDGDGGAVGKGIALRRGQKDLGIVRLAGLKRGGRQAAAWICFKGAAVEPVGRLHREARAGGNAHRGGDRPGIAAACGGQRQRQGHRGNLRVGGGGGSLESGRDLDFRGGHGEDIVPFAVGGRHGGIQINRVNGDGFNDISLRRSHRQPHGFAFICRGLVRCDRAVKTIVQADLIGAFRPSRGRQRHGKAQRQHQRQ